MKRPSVWCNRAIMQLHAYFALCLDEASFHAELKKLEIPQKSWPPFLATPQANATCHEFDSKDGTNSFIVCIEERKDIDAIQVASLLVHEAVHIWQSYCNHIGERSPSIEFEAYSIQWLSQQLMYSFVEQKDFKRLTSRRKRKTKGE